MPSLRPSVAVAPAAIAFLAIRLACVAVPAHANAAPAAETPVVSAAAAKADEADRLYALGEYREALVAFREAYRRDPRPDLLFNAAQCHRKLGERALAVDVYRAYLRTGPPAEQRAVVETLVATLKREQEEEMRRAREAHASAPGATVVVTAAAPPTPPPAAPPPVYRRTWFWWTLGAAVVGGSVAAFWAARAERGEASFVCVECDGAPVRVSGR